MHFRLLAYSCRAPAVLTAEHRKHLRRAITALNVTDNRIAAR